MALGTDPLDGTDYFGIVINAALPIPPPPGSEVGREWVELFNAGLGTKSLAGFRLQTALPSGWSNVFTFPAGVALDSGDFMVIGNGTNGDFQPISTCPTVPSPLRGSFASAWRNPIPSSTWRTPCSTASPTNSDFPRRLRRGAAHRAAPHELGRSPDMGDSTPTTPATEERARLALAPSPPRRTSGL